MKIAFISLGCPKNQVDADVLCHQLLSHGHTTVSDITEADCIIVNTCGFIESAKQESIDNILMACQQKENNQNLKVVVTGCLAERYKQELADEIQEVDAVVGIGSNSEICEILNRIQQEKVQSYGEKTSLELGGKRVISTPSHFAYLKISEGCNNRCHYCAIPLIRGKLRSRDFNDIIDEAKWLVAEGVKEIILVAQDITAYGDDKGKNQICELLTALNDIEGIGFIRIMYAYPERITDEFIDTLVKCNHVLKYIDVPIQHINTEVLKNMNRKGTRETVISALDRLRAKIKDITIRSTLITGYPDETEEQFLELCDFVKEYKIDRLGCFAYSQEEDTVAATMPNQIDMEIREKRAEIIMRIQAEVMAEKQSAMVSKQIDVICDDYDDQEQVFICRYLNSDAPEIDAVCYVKTEKMLRQGEIYKVEVLESDMYDLYAQLV